MFTVEEFNEVYTKYITGHGMVCKCTEYCHKYTKCTFCPLYYMNSVSTILFMLNNTPAYPKSNLVYLETQNEVKKVAYYDKYLSSWEEIDYTCEN